MRAYGMAASKGREGLIQMLYLNGQELKAIPASIQQMKQLKLLDLSNNRILHLPDWLEELDQLEELHLSGNKGLASFVKIPIPKGLLRLYVKDIGWEDLPETITSLGKLKVLDISYNKIKALPASLKKLSKIRSLFASNNVLKTLPDGLASLTQLKELDLRYNQLKKLPLALGECSHLYHLKLANNQLTRLPKSLGQLRQLNELDVSANRLRQLPFEIGACEMLRRVYLQDNRLKQLPGSITSLQWLTQIDLGNNKFSQFPEALLSCKRLTELSLQANQLKYLPDLTSSTKMLRLKLANNQLSKWSALPVSLKEIQLDHNQLSDLDPVGRLKSLQRITFSNNQITTFTNGFWQFPQLTTIQAKRNPAKMSPTAFLECMELTQIEGLITAREKRSLLEFLSIARQSGWKAKEVVNFFPLFKNDSEAWKALRIEQGWKGLNSADPYFADSFRKHFFKKTRGGERLKKGSSVAFVGTVFSAFPILEERLAKQKMITTPYWDSTTTHLVLGLPPFPDLPPPDSIPWLSESRLTRFLDNKEGRALSKEKVGHKLQKLRALLLNKEEVNCRLALQLLEGGGVPKRLMTDLLFLYLTKPFPRLDDSLKRLLFPYLPEITKAVLAKKIVLPGDFGDKKGWQRWLGTREIDVNRLLDLMRATLDQTYK